MGLRWGSYFARRGQCAGSTLRQGLIEVQKYVGDDGPGGELGNFAAVVAIGSGDAAEPREVMALAAAGSRP